MSYIPKNPLTPTRRRMITRQQMSDVLSYGYIITRPSFAKHTQMYLERLITKSKNDCLVNRKKAHSVLLKTTKFSKDRLVQRLFTEISKKYQNRNGGYTRRLKTEKGILLQLV